MRGLRRSANHHRKAMNNTVNHGERVRRMLTLIRLLRMGDQRVKQLFVTVAVGRALMQRFAAALPTSLPVGTSNVCTAKGVFLKPLMNEPMEPNSGYRKRVLFRLPNGKEVVAYMSGTGHNLSQPNIVLLRVGRFKNNKSTIGCSQQARLGRRRPAK